jgi:hypothetical protein
MRRELKGRPGRGIGPLKEKTVHAALTKQRIHAIELEHRRATGKASRRGSRFATCYRGTRVCRARSNCWDRPIVPREINRLEQTKSVPPVIDVIAEPILALPGLINTRDGASGDQPAANVSHDAAHPPGCNRKSLKTMTTWSGEARPGFYKTGHFSNISDHETLSDEVGSSIVSCRAA